MANRYLNQACSILFLACCAVAGYSQAASTPQFGIVPTGSYQAYDIDSVNMDNGIDTLTIPLFSLPQLGKLSLSFSAVANTTYWQPEKTFDYGTVYTYSYRPTSASYNAIDQPYTASGFAGSGIGPHIIPNSIPYVGVTPYSQDGCFRLSDGSTASCLSDYWSVINSSGGSHPLYYNAANTEQLRTTDGSGYLVSTGVTAPSEAVTNLVLVDPNGVTSSFTYADPDLGDLTNIVETDPDGNSIAAAISSGWQFTDSVGRTIPPIPQPTSSTVGCPNLNQAYQVAVSSSQWQVPGANNTTSTYLLCYATITYHTDFFGHGGQSYNTLTEEGGGDIYEESTGAVNVIQAIVLPDNTYWGFVYDSANPADNTSIAYGLLKEVMLPTGGSISYSYAMPATQNCSVNGYTTYLLSKRTVSDGNGDSYVWKYSFGTPYTGNLVTDPNNDDTVYVYQSPSWSGGQGQASNCNDLEVSRSIYGGSHTSGTLLRKVVTTYQTTPAPQPYAKPEPSSEGYGNALPNTVVTTLDTGVSTTTSNGFGGSFLATMPTCYEWYNLSLSEWICTPIASAAMSLTLSIPTSTSITDYSGAILNATTTSYEWQSNSSYLAANLLDTPSVVTTYNGSGIQVAQTTTSYDGSISFNGSPCIADTGVTAGHPTEVSRWNNTGSPVTTYTCYTTKGMTNFTVDGDGDISSTFAYNYQADGSQFINLYPSSVANARGQSTQFTWDVNTGKQASVTDPNGVVTGYSYDSMSRIKQILSAVGTPQESEITYSYPNAVTVSVNKDLTVLNDQKLAWSTTADGLGRAIQTTYPNGTVQATSYNGLDNVMCVSNPQLSVSNGTACNQYSAFTSYSYDALSRKIGQTDSDRTSAQSWNYSGNTVTHTDENLNQWMFTSDALGRLTNVLEPSGTGTAPSMQTNYRYDTIGNLLSVTQLGNGTPDIPRSRTFTYDSLSRLICSANPENSIAACPATASSYSYVTGTTGYTYDGNGNVLTKMSPAVNTTSPPGTQTIGYSFDNLNRLCYKVYGGSAPSQSPSGCPSQAPSGSIVAFFYDSSSISGASNTIGRLTDEKSYAGNSLASEREPYSYDPFGRLLNEAQCAFGGCPTEAFQMGYTYNLAGELTSSTDGTTPTQSSSSPSSPCTGSPSYGTSLTFINCYDTAGQLLTVTSNSAASPMTLFSAQGYAPFGGLTGAQLGSGLTLTRTYDNRLRVSSESDVGTNAAATNGSATVTIMGAEQSK